jgi:hypothetical protein
MVATAAEGEAAFDIKQQVKKGWKEATRTIGQYKSS